ncbi:MAG: putative phosphoribosyl transferase [Acidimicrobiaceae bacterium]
MRRGPLADRLRQLPDLLGEPCHRSGGSPRPITLAVGVAHELLEASEVHNRRIFANRQDAGRQLGEALGDLTPVADVVVLGLPRGGVPVAHEVAAAIGAPLDVFVVRKLGAPSQPELALGAVASGGTIVLNDEILRHLGVDRARLDAIIAAERAVVDERDLAYRGDRAPLAVEGQTVVVVDDGLATGATMRAALAALRTRNVGELVAAAPVAPPEVVTMLDGEADRVVVLEAPDRFIAVGAWYGDFRQVSDEEVRELIR